MVAEEEGKAISARTKAALAAAKKRNPKLKLGGFRGGTITSTIRKLAGPLRRLVPPPALRACHHRTSVSRNNQLERPCPRADRTRHTDRYRRHRVERRTGHARAGAQVEQPVRRHK